MARHDFQQHSGEKKAKRIYIPFIVIGAILMMAANRKLELQRAIASFLYKSKVRTMKFFLVEK